MDAGEGVVRNFTNGELAAIENDAEDIFFMELSRLSGMECIHWVALAKDLARELRRQQEKRERNEH